MKALLAAVSDRLVSIMSRMQNISVGMLFLCAEGRDFSSLLLLADSSVCSAAVALWLALHPLLGASKVVQGWDLRHCHLGQEKQEKVPVTKRKKGPARRKPESQSGVSMFILL